LYGEFSSENVFDRYAHDNSHVGENGKKYCHFECEITQKTNELEKTRMQSDELEQTRVQSDELEKTRKTSRKRKDFMRKRTDFTNLCSDTKRCKTDDLVRPALLSDVTSKNVNARMICVGQELRLVPKQFRCPYCDFIAASMESLLSHTFTTQKGGHNGDPDDWYHGVDPYRFKCDFPECRRSLYGFRKGFLRHLAYKNHTMNEHFIETSTSRNSTVVMNGDSTVIMTGKSMVLMNGKQVTIKHRWIPSSYFTKIVNEVRDAHFKKTLCRI